jgi:hypothetical protein
MLNKSISLFLVSLMVTGLLGCSQVQLTTAVVTPEPVSTAEPAPVVTTAKTISLNTNVKDLALQDIKEIQIDGKVLDKKDYSVSSGKLILPELSEGKHVIRFSHITLGDVDIPVEIINGISNNFQFNLLLNENQIDSWEVGLDANLDGLIDENSFYSRDFKSYVVVRDNSEDLKYLPKDGFAGDFRGGIQPPRPDGFNFPDLKENEFKNNAQQPPRPEGTTLIKGDQLDYPFPGNIAIPLADNADKLQGYRAVAITNEDTIFPISTYIIKNNLLLLDTKTFKAQKIIKLYLLEDTGRGILLRIDALKPLITAPSPISQEIPKPPVNMPVPPVGPSGGPGRPNMPPPGNMGGSPPPNMPPLNAPENPNGNPKPIVADGTSDLTLIKSSDLKFTLSDNVKLTEDDLKKLNIYEEVFIAPGQPQNATKKTLLPVPNSVNQQEGGYIQITPEGEMVDYIPMKDFKPDADTTILNSKN